MFDTNQLDPLIASEVMELLGSAHYDLNNPKKLNQIRDIVTYFKNVPNHRFKMLKVLSNKSGDKLDILWTYVALQKEKEEKTKTLNPEHFEPDVASEIAKGYLTEDKMALVRKDLERMKLERKKAEQQEAKELSEKSKAISKIPIEAIEDTLTDLSFINKELKAYE